MKALSIRPDYVADIFDGNKTKEYRSWNTSHRGKLLICATARKLPGFVSGHATCVVDLTDVKKLSDGTFAWIIENVEVIKPVPVKGQQRLFDVDDELIKYPSKEDVEIIDGEEYINQQFWDTYYEPLVN